jgi:dienelactone hydrolase
VKVFAALLLVGAGIARAQTPTAPPTDAPVRARWVAQEFLMPVALAPRGLDVVKVEVERPGKHPLAILTHGTAAEPEERATVTPWRYMAQAIWFAQRGYVVLIVVRKGYGRSDGKQDSQFGGCNGGSFSETADESAVDLRAAASYGAKLPEVDATTIVSAGVSTGGFAQVALSADPPPGLKVAISFAGGRGGDGKEHNCNLGGLISAFHGFGKKSKVPMLWIYAENDHWFPPAMAHSFDDAFKKGGGNNQFVMVPPYHDDGHDFYGDVSGWSPIVEPFLKEHGLLPLAELLPEPVPPNVPPPADLGGRGLAAFQHFLIMGPAKAFATNGKGTWGTANGQWDQASADKKALENCSKAAATASGGTCTLASRGK